MTQPTTVERRDVHSLGFGDHQMRTTDVACPNCGEGCDCFGEEVEVCAACDEDWPCAVGQAYQAGRQHGMAEVAIHFDRTFGPSIRRYARSNVVTPVPGEAS